MSDADAQMALPGATVVASWTIDGVPGRAEVQTSIDGGFTLCYVPLATELSVLGMIGPISGQPLAITLTDPITRQDVEVSLTSATSGSGAEAGEEKMLACLGAPDSEFRFRVRDLVHCDPRWPGLERCPRKDLGRVSVTVTAGPSRGRRFSGEGIERLIDQAERLGANALVNYKAVGGLIAAQAAFIEVDPATC